MRRMPRSNKSKRMRPLPLNSSVSLMRRLPLLISSVSLMRKLLPLILSALKMRRPLPLNSSVSLMRRLPNSRKKRTSKLMLRMPRKKRRKELLLRVKARVQPTMRHRMPQSKRTSPRTRKRKRIIKRSSELDRCPPKTLLYPTQYITHIYEN